MLPKKKAWELIPLEDLIILGQILGQQISKRIKVDIPDTIKAEVPEIGPIKVDMPTPPPPRTINKKDYPVKSSYSIFNLGNHMGTMHIVTVISPSSGFRLKLTLDDTTYYDQTYDDYYDIAADDPFVSCYSYRGYYKLSIGGSPSPFTFKRSAECTLTVDNPTTFKRLWAVLTYKKLGR